MNLPTEPWSVLWTLECRHTGRTRGGLFPSMQESRVCPWAGSLLPYQVRDKLREDDAVAPTWLLTCSAVGG